MFKDQVYGVIKDLKDGATAKQIIKTVRGTRQLKSAQCMTYASLNDLKKEGRIEVIRNGYGPQRYAIPASQKIKTKKMAYQNPYNKRKNYSDILIDIKAPKVAHQNKSGMATDLLTGLDEEETTHATVIENKPHTATSSFYQWWTEQGPISIGNIVGIDVDPEGRLKPLVRWFETCYKHAFEAGKNSK